MAKSKKDPVRIVVLQRGWVYVGRLKRGKEECIISNAKCIRYWGTSKGLGELVNGPLSGTKLDDANVVRYHPLTEINTIDCNEEAWSKIL